MVPMDAPTELSKVASVWDASPDGFYRAFGPPRRSLRCSGHIGADGRFIRIGAPDGAPCYATSFHRVASLNLELALKWVFELRL